MSESQDELQQAVQPRPAPVGWGTQIVQMSRPTPEGVENKIMIEVTLFHPLGRTVTFWSPDDLHRLARDLKGVASDANRAQGAQSNGSGLLTPEEPRIILPGQG